MLDNLETAARSVDATLFGHLFALWGVLDESGRVIEISGAIFKDVKVENARWVGHLLGRLSDKQLQDAFRSSGFNEQETAAYTRTMRQRIQELQALR